MPIDLILTSMSDCSNKSLMISIFPFSTDICNAALIIINVEFHANHINETT